MLMILTTVDNVNLNYRKDNEKALSTVNVRQARNYLKEKQFEKGSMLPKVEAAIEFVEMGANHKAVITSISRAKAAVKGQAGTFIVNE